MKDERAGAAASMVNGHRSSGDAWEAATSDEARPAASSWREILREHAARIWRQEESRSSLPASQAASLTMSLGPLADDALRIVEAYALGASSTGGSQNATELGARLELILNGIETSLTSGAAAGRTQPEAPPHVFQSELWQLLRKIRESAELAYSREQILIELDRRILFLLFDRGPLVPADISSAVGVDKAQVSRSVKRMLELRLVEREQIRAPLRLTRDGERLGRRMSRLAELRNRELTIDVSDDELAAFFDTIEVLLDRAVALYDQERELAGGKEPQPTGRAATVRPGEKVVIDRSRVVAPLMTLSAYFSRSGALAFKRLTGLSTFEAFVLSEIGMTPPVDWATLVGALARDHSQASRTVTSLMERGLVEREGKPGRRHGRFFPTEQGGRLFDVIHEAGRQRSTFLLAPLAPEQRERFLATFEKVRRNAASQLERERAFAEIDRP